MPTADAATGPARALDRIAFLHIPKTAGTALTQALAAHWGRVRIIGAWPQLQETPPDGLADITLFAGHFLAHQLAHPALAGFAPVCVLRDPLARLVSEYRFARTTREAGQPLTAQMAYALRAGGFFEYAFSGIAAWGRHAQLFILGMDADTLPLQAPQAALLERAKARLDGMRVGVTEGLDAFARGLFADAGVPAPPDPLPRALDQGPPGEDGLTAAQRAVLREVMAPDYALHAHARDAMARWLERVGG